MKAWYDEAIFYQLYPLGLCKKSINEIYAWIPHIKDMGYTAVYFSPIFESDTHGYDTIDYKKIDSRLGTNEDFRNLVKELHKNEIHVVIDAVFNHTGKNFFACKDIQQKGYSSEYVDFYKYSNRDKLEYYLWNGNKDLLTLNLTNPKVSEYLFEVVRFWIDTFEIDGLRLDCADCLDFNFLRNLRKVCLNKKSDFWLLGEVIHGDYNLWANHETLNSTTNYEAYKSLFSSHNDKNLFEIAYSLTREFGEQGIYKNLKLYNFIDNHDVSRIASTVIIKNYLYTIATLLFTIPGLPSIYYGTEWLATGKKENHCDWNLRPYIDVGSQKDTHFERHLKNLISIRKKNNCLLHGDYKQLFLKSEQFAFQRNYENQSMVVAINISSDNSKINIPLKNGKYFDCLNNKEYMVTNSVLDIGLFPYWGVILQKI